MTQEESIFIAGYYAGFMSSGEGYNGEVPFSYKHPPSYDKELLQSAKEKFEEYVQRQRASKTSQR